MTNETAPRLTLVSETLPNVPDPDDQMVEWAVGKLSDANFFTLVERPGGGFAQIGYGEKAGCRAGTYALEFRETPAGDQFRAETTDIAEATRFLQAFANGDADAKNRHVWEKLEL